MKNLLTLVENQRGKLNKRQIDKKTFEINDKQRENLAGRSIEKPSNLMGVQKRKLILSLSY